jgi:hypothetical protein
MRVCLEPGCPRIQAEPRCPEHRSVRERQRGTRQQRGYDSDYDSRRRADTKAMANGAVLTCWRCGQVVLPHDYSLGHCDDDRTVIHGPEHLTQCNLANTRGGCPHPSHAGISPDA